MTELRKCSRCHSIIELSHYSLNRKGEYFKCCDNCRTNNREWRREYLPKWDGETICEHCGDRTTKSAKSIHKRRYWCKISNLEVKPTFEDWLMKQDYNTLLWEYKKTFEELLNKNKELNNASSSSSTTA